jgi:hypothetical protein
MHGGVALGIGVVVASSPKAASHAFGSERLVNSVARFARSG